MVGELTKATIEVVDEVTYFTCHGCGYRWRPRKQNPVECPCCKVHLRVSQMMADKIKEKNAPAEIQDVKSIMPEFFTATCVFEECEEDAVAKFSGQMLCELHLLRMLKERKVLKDI